MKPIRDRKKLAISAKKRKAVSKIERPQSKEQTSKKEYYALTPLLIPSKK